MQSLVASLVLPTVAAAFSFQPLPRAHAAVPVRHRAITAIAPLEGFDIPADAFDAPPPAALEIGSSGGIVDVLVMVVFFFTYLERLQTQVRSLEMTLMRTKLA